MAKRKGMSKKELRAPDEFQSFFIELTNKYGNYWKIALVILILIIIVPLIWSGYSYYLRKKEEKAAYNYAILLKQKPNIQKLEKFYSKFKGTGPAVWALLEESKILIQQNKIDDALKILKKAKNEALDDNIKLLINLNIGVCYFKEKKFNEAKSVFSSLRERNIVAAEALYYLAKIYEKENKIMDAKALYQEIIEKYKNFPYYNVVNYKLKSL